MDITYDFSDFEYVIGLDEVGTGCVCGPVFVGVAVYKSKFTHKSIKDSKAFTTEKSRNAALEVVKSTAAYTALKSANANALQSRGQGAVLQRLFLEAAQEAVSLYPNSIVIIDGANKIKGLNHPQMNIVKADAKITAVSAASIVAKCHRDDVMTAYGYCYPEYGWHKNKGYGTQEHWKAIEKHGIVVGLHRLNIEHIKECLDKFGEYRREEKEIE